MEINFFKHFEIIQKMLPHLDWNSGRIINVTSTMGRVSSPFHAPYASTKFAYEAFSDSLRLELRISGSGIKVAIINPGSTRSNVWGFLCIDYMEFLDSKPSEAIEQYGDGYEKFTKTFSDFEKNAVPAIKVVKAIDHALCSKRPKIHYYPSLDALFFNYIYRPLPDRLRDLISLLIIGVNPFSLKSVSKNVSCAKQTIMLETHK